MTLDIFDLLVDKELSMPSDMPKRIIVLGMLRSGTSLTAELIRRWGAYSGGEDNLWKSDVNDRRGYGYMEYIPLQELNDELLDHNDRVPPSKEVMEDKAADPALRKKALELLRQMDQEAQDRHVNAWVWKDARLPLTLPFWTQLWGDPAFVITIRHPAEVALSSAKMGGVSEENFPFSAGLLYWQFCMLNILTLTQTSLFKIFISYEELVGDSLDQCGRLVAFLDKLAGYPADASSDKVPAMVQHVDTKQHHHRYGKSLAEMSQSTREQRALYHFLRIKTRYPDEPFLESDFALYPGWKEYLQVIDATFNLGEFGSGVA
jgi:hypothetical protein